MNRGIYAVTSGMRSLLEIQGVLIDNLVNINTPAFKQEIPLLSSFPEEMQVVRVEPGGAKAPLGRVSMGTSFQGDRLLDFSQGPLEPSDNPLALAIGGDGFFVVQTPEGERYTRNGNFGRDAAGYLVTDQGYRVLGDVGPIQLPDGEVTVDRDGTIWVNGERIARLTLVRFPDPQSLERAGRGLFIGQDPEPVLAGEAIVYQGYLERANVDVAAALVRMTAALRSYEANQRVLQLQDNTLSRVLELGRV